MLMTRNIKKVNKYMNDQYNLLKNKLIILKMVNYKC